MRLGKPGDKCYTFRTMNKLVYLSLGLALAGFGCSTPASTPVVTPDAVKPSEPSSSAITPSSTSMTSSTQPSWQPTEAQVTTSFSLVPSAPVVKQKEAYAFPGVLPGKELEGLHVRIKTKKGDIVFEILPKEGPKASSNFAYLTKNGFYDGLVFHRVVPGFVIQGGDPMGADANLAGQGGPGYSFPDDPVSMPYNQGIVAMANSGPNTNGSQFFIMLENNPLPPSYSIFGRVTQGIEVVKQITVGDVMQSVTLEK